MLRGRKLLLADDSLAIQKIIELTFESEGMEVVSVGNGQLAVERLAEVRPDIVLADVFMPELNGYEVCERIKGNEQFRHIPVILLVGSFEPFNEAEARKVGADDYLTKPFQSIRQMVSKVGALLSGNKSQAEATTQELPGQATQSKNESQSHLDNLELTTADTAPLPQHMRPGATADANAAPKKPFAELQLDDEMIEEIPANQFGSAGQSSPSSHQQPTEPLSTQDLAEVSAPTATVATTTSQQPSNGDAGLLADEASEAAPSVVSTAAYGSDRATASDDALLDLDDVEMPRSSALSEADDFILDLQDEAEPQATGFTEAQSVVSEQQAEPASVFAQTITSEESLQTEAEPEMQVAPDTSQLQETHELSSEPQPVPTDELPETFQPDTTRAQAEATTAPQSVQAAEATTSQPGQIGIEQLSPEVIEHIARRVVEQLSTKVVEQIAWEVVPQLAELLIKRRLEEEGSNKQ